VRKWKKKGKKLRRCNQFSTTFLKTKGRFSTTYLEAGHQHERSHGDGEGVGGVQRHSHRGRSRRVNRGNEEKAAGQQVAEQVGI